MTVSEPDWITAIAEVRPDEVIIRGYSLDDLIGRLTFTEMAFLVGVGRLPSAGETRMLDALLVSLTEHGISPSTMIVRMLASCGTPVQAAVAGGVLSIADWHGGAGEELGRLLAEVTAEARDEDELRSRLQTIVDSYRQARRRLEGFGHPQHPEGDPRAQTLLRLQTELDLERRHAHALGVLAELLSASLGRRMPPNVNGALAAIALDLGYPWRAIRGLVIAPRAIGLTTHVVEEIESGSRWRHARADAVSYVGPEKRPFDEHS